MQAKLTVEIPGSRTRELKIKVKEGFELKELGQFLTLMRLWEDLFPGSVLGIELEG